MQVRLNEEQLEFYKRHHYVHLPNVVPEQALLLAERIISKWVDDLVEAWSEQKLITDKKQELDFQHRLVQIWHDAGKPKYGRSPRRDLVGRDMYNFLKDPALLDIAQQLLETEDVSVHGIFNARPKLPDQKWTDTPWHQDAQYYRDAENTHVVSIWMPLQRVTEFNSCLQIAPGFFDRTLLDGVIDEETNFLGLKREDAAKLTALSVEMQRGDALCFTQLLPHRALPNQSDAVRWSMDIRYEATAVATESGKAQGFIARSPMQPSSEASYEKWLSQWTAIPAGSY
ncbi:phytanoyl-CoA dioxygenase family protein [Paenibacillus sp. CF384]|uniref:phytanoyl-CoA dioxygenase family protein n=1 Tax=Paenibacillus sp. CF384 TaxID=1884382 RepID=UPI00089A9427|nr:phytanoyl-CoA dioxygenase family protein [Paenibacillus sp. CF384]SDW34302.1 Ectoine hydroxylase-related dioxygenase, phytanoyl-CoA dioxygenase (PhyH) family [Paenibacillus sp. CF384]